MIAYVCVCLDVTQGATNRNRCTQRLVILHAQTYGRLIISAFHFTCNQLITHKLGGTLPLLSTRPAVSY